MGLFGPGTSYSRMGGGADGAAAHKAVEDIARAVEADLQDTPGEYFALQAGGMLFASQANAVSGIAPVGSMDESIERVAQIMTVFEDKPSTKPEILRVKASEIYESLRTAAANGAKPSLLVGYLNDYLHYVDNGYLKRSTTVQSRPTITPAKPYPSSPTSPDKRQRRWWQVWK